MWRPVDREARSPSEKEFLLLQLCQDAVVTHCKAAIAVVMGLTIIGIVGTRTRDVARSIAYAQVTIVVSCTCFLTFVYLAAEALHAEGAPDQYVSP